MTKKAVIKPFGQGKTIVESGMGISVWDVPFDEMKGNDDFIEGSNAVMEFKNGCVIGNLDEGKLHFSSWLDNDELVKTITTTNTGDSIKVSDGNGVTSGTVTLPNGYASDRTFDGWGGGYVQPWNPEPWQQEYYHDYYKQYLPQKYGQIDWGRNIFCPYIPEFVTKNQETDKETMCKRRLVQVYVVDPDVRVPDENAVLYKGDEVVTIETDEEIRDGLDLKKWLKKHNEFRKTVLDEVKSDEGDRDIFLREIRIKDLSIEIFEVVVFK